MILVESIYIGHGAPLNAIWDTKYRDHIQQFAQQTDLPEAIVVVSAHFERHLPLQITSASRPGIVYDYYGFPEEMYQLQYDPPGDPNLAKTLAASLEKIGLNPQLNPKQGLDHGAWVPLKVMYPDATIPILQISIPIPRGPEDLYRIGQQLRSFRDQGIMFMGSGNLIHNLPHALSKLNQSGLGINAFTQLPAEQWAVEIDQWLKTQLDTQQYQLLLRASQELEHFKAAAPTTEHFDPLYFILGTMTDSEGISYIHEGFEGGSISMRSFSAQS